MEPALSVAVLEGGEAPSLERVDAARVGRRAHQVLHLLIAGGLEVHVPLTDPAKALRGHGDDHLVCAALELAHSIARRDGEGGDQAPRALFRDRLERGGKTRLGLDAIAYDDHGAVG